MVCWEVVENLTWDENPVADPQLVCIQIIKTGMNMHMWSMV